MGASIRRFQRIYPWIKAPLIVGAPMRVISGPHLAVAISRAGGLGFIGPGATPESTGDDLATARDLLEKNPFQDQKPITLASLLPHLNVSPFNEEGEGGEGGAEVVGGEVAGGEETGREEEAVAEEKGSEAATPQPETLPIGVGFQLWNGDLRTAARAVGEHRPCAAWLFAPRHGQPELDEWAAGLRQASPGLQIWTQIGTVAEAIAATAYASASETERTRANDGRGGRTRVSFYETSADVLVVQGAEAGGHGRARDGLGIASLLPEIRDQESVADAVRRYGVALVAAGGIADGRGVAAALGLGAAGVAMGTRFLASTEARVARGYRDEVVRARDGAVSTTRTMLYNRLRGTTGWPEEYSPRAIINRSWRDYYEYGVEYDEVKWRYDEMVRRTGASGNAKGGYGPDGRLATYAGAAVGLVRDVRDAGVLVKDIRDEACDILRGLTLLYPREPIQSDNLSILVKK
ncbi:hypothetical protein SLS62_000614 [Diatrype stigma]|uniref:Nitronate monooxygenase domain-containing protein n=1 Tax=Diatrype stigma TaxID=117547 RepID=A0AAN9UXV6_9PEZI